jgi:hypothetical protein
MAKTRVYYEFRSIETNQTLVLENPAQVTFQVNGGLGSSLVINNNYLLVGRIESFTNYTDPWELILNNNENEIDVTQYSIRFNTPCVLNVIIKYYDKSEDI